MPEPDALAALVDYARETRSKGMIGSRLMMPGRSDVAWSRGLKWNKWSIKLTALDILAPISLRPTLEDVETRMDSPTGCTMYGHERMHRTGRADRRVLPPLRRETDWGVRAKPTCGVGYAHNSVVSHISGTTTGAVSNRAEQCRRSPSTCRIEISFTSSAGAPPSLVRLDGVRVLSCELSFLSRRVEEQFHCRGSRAGGWIARRRLEDRDHLIERLNRQK